MSTKVEIRGKVPPSGAVAQEHDLPSSSLAATNAARDSEGSLKEEGAGKPLQQQRQQQQKHDEVGSASATSSGSGGGDSGESSSGRGNTAPAGAKRSPDVEDDFLHLDIEDSDKKDGTVEAATASARPTAAAPAAPGEDVAPAEGTGLVASASKELLAKLVRSLSTPMMDGMDDWAGVEDPDWKANHQLGWEQLTDVKEIGKGLTCTVYTARIPGRKAKVIAKVARPRNKGRLEDQAERQLEAEFNVLRQTNHPHVVELLGAGFTPEGRRFLLLEHLPEGTLGTFHALSAKEEMRGPSAYWTLKQGFRRLTKDLTYTLGNLLQVAEALQYLHNDAIPGAVIIHRDIRPDNVGLARGLVVKIFDFGLSRAIVKGHTMVGEVGSLRYSAPEVSMALPHGEKADVYSWALLAWSVTSGRTPFEGVGRSSFYARVVIGGERPPLDPGWPKEFRSILEDCWGRDPTTRPDMTEVVTRMKDVLGVSP